MSAAEVALIDARSYALAYAERGWRVVPIAPGKKHPPLQDWRNQATTDPEAIERWWGPGGPYADHGVGIVTGAASGVWVLDVDTDGKPGAESFQALRAQIGELPRTVSARTGSGGGHLFFRWDPAHPVHNGMATRLGPGLDIRGEGGQVVVAPTVHPCGEPYAWIDDLDPWGDQDVADAPAKLYALIDPPEDPQEAPRLSPGPRPTRMDGGIPARLDDEGPAEWFRANNRWPDLLERYGWCLESDRGAETRWTRPGKTPREGHSAVLHNHGAGPLNVFSTDAEVVGLWEIGTPSADGQTTSLTPFEFYAAYEHRGDLHEAARVIRATMPRPAAISDLVAPPGPAEAPTVSAKVLTFGQVLHLPPPDPLIDGWLDLGMVASMPGQYGSLKSFLTMSMTLSVATGTPWLGHEVKAPGPAVYASLEGAYTLPDRYQGWADYHEVNPDALADHHTWHAPLNLGNADQVAEFAGWLADVRPRLVVIDTMSKARPGADENTENPWHALDHLRRATSGGTVLGVNHTGHVAQKRARGASAQEDDADVVLALTGRWRDGPVLLESVKQKARPDPPPMWVGLEMIDGRPVVVPMTEPTADGGDGGTAEIKALVVATVAREWPDGYRPTKADLTKPESRAHIARPRDQVRKAVGLLVAEGRLGFERGRRPGDRQDMDLLVVLKGAE